MGYYMNQRAASFRIKQQNIFKALAAVQALHGNETIKDGSGRYLSWVDQDFHKRTTLLEILDCWRWQIEKDRQTGDVVDICFNGEKLGDDETLFSALAPFVEDGSFIEMGGEDDALWRWVFKGGKCQEVYAEITWPEA